MADQNGHSGGIRSRISRRFGWGLADQMMCSLSNAALSFYIARELGAAQFGAFSLAWVTYAFALNASRGLATDPLLVRYSSAELPAWRRAISRSTGTSMVVGLILGACALGAAAALSGTPRLAFIALGLSLPGLLLQDSWRYAFFALGRGSQSFINDTIWTITLLPAIVVLKITHHTSVFWFVLLWGATASIAACMGAIQAWVIPRPAAAWEWVSSHRDLGPRYLVENTANSGSAQLRTYCLGAIAGLASVGVLQAAALLLGPFMVIFMGISLVTVPEAARILKSSPQHLRPYCVLVGGGLATMGLLWGMVLLVALPRGLGHLLLGERLWQPAYELVLPFTISVMGACLISGAGAGLHALGAARRSARTMILSSSIYLGCGVAGAFWDGALGAIWGAAIATWVGALLWWQQLRVGMRQAGVPTTWRRRPTGLPVTAYPGSAVAEAFRFAAGAIERLRVVRGPQLAMAFVSAVGGEGKSAVVANLALALAEGGTRVLVVDADSGLAARLLPGIAGEAGLEHVLAGQRALIDCAEASPLNSAMAVLRSGRLTTGRITGAARMHAAAKVLAEAKASYDIVLIDTPALLRVADATEIVGAADAAVIVISPEEPVRDHYKMAERLRLVEAEVAGYVYLQASMPSVLSLGGTALFDHARSASQSSPNVRVLEDSDDTTATATSQPPQE
jgi:Mrp family chromosome partitioning ATPase